MAGDPLVAAAITAQTAEFAAWHAYNIAQDTALSVATGVQTALLTAQIGIYWNEADNAIDARDVVIDSQISFMDTLENLKETVDLPMVICKKDILTDLELPNIDRCSSVIYMSDLSEDDGDAIIQKSEHLGNESCGGIPADWSNHEGSLHAAKAGSYVGGLLANSEKRRVEAFTSAQLSLTRAAHSGIKSIYSAGETLSKYAQSASIHSGLADLWIQGFNSAGAGLGVALAQLQGSGTSNGNNISVDNNNPGIALGAGTANNVGVLT